MKSSTARPASSLVFGLLLRLLSGELSGVSTLAGAASGADGDAIGSAGLLTLPRKLLRAARARARAAALPGLGPRLLAATSAARPAPCSRLSRSEPDESERVSEPGAAIGLGVPKPAPAGTLRRCGIRTCRGIATGASLDTPGRHVALGWAPFCAGGRKSGTRADACNEPRLTPSSDCDLADAVDLRPSFSLLGPLLARLALCRSNATLARLTRPPPLPPPPPPSPVSRSSASHTTPLSRSSRSLCCSCDSSDSRLPISHSACA